MSALFATPHAPLCTAPRTAAGLKTQLDPELLEFLDLRFGYSPEDAAAALEAWTPQGRLVYLMVEALDVAVYCTAYRGAAVVGINW